jgi:hypothetical protein
MPHSALAEVAAALVAVLAVAAAGRTVRARGHRAVGAVLTVGLLLLAAWYVAAGLGHQA